MFHQRLGQALPYAIVLAVSVWFYVMALGINYSARGDNLGPDFWPRLILSVAILICALQLARLVLFSRPDHEKPVVTEALEEDDDAPRSNLLLGAGIALVVAYGAMVTLLGFLLSTALFMVLFMYASGYRSHGVIWLSSIVGTVLLTVLFQRVVYVSLPRGVPPFDRVADTILALF